MKNKVFLDTSFSLALTIKDDAKHLQAVELSLELAKSRIKVVTTQAIILEIGNAFARSRYRHHAINIIAGLNEDPNTTIVPLSTRLINTAFELFSNRTDKQWGLVDCISFIVMHDRKIEDALTADDHFVQAGFRALLKDEVN